MQTIAESNMPWFYDREGRLPMRACRYCRQEFKPNTYKSVMCDKCHFLTEKERKELKQNATAV